MKIKKIIASIISLIFITMIVSGSTILDDNGINNNIIEISAVNTSSWQDAYKDKLQDFYKNQNKFYFAYIDNDDIPELLISESSAHVFGVDIYGYVDNKVVLYGSYGTYGGIFYNEKTGYIISSCINLGYLSSNGTSIDTEGCVFIHKLSNGKISSIEAYTYTIDSSNTIHYYNNNSKEITFDEWKKLLSQYSLNISSVDDLNTENINKIKDIGINIVGYDYNMYDINQENINKYIPITNAVTTTTSNTIATTTSDTIATTTSNILTTTTIPTTTSNDTNKSDAEKIAQILMDNKSVWNTLIDNDIYNTSENRGLMFLDVNLDGTLELVVYNMQGSQKDTYIEIFNIDIKNQKVTKLENALKPSTIDNSSYSVDIGLRNIKLYTAIKDYDKMYIKGDTFYLGTDEFHSNSNYVEEVIMKFGGNLGFNQVGVFNTITNNGTKKYYQSKFGTDIDIWLQNNSNDEQSYYDGLKNLNLTYEIVNFKDINKDSLIKSYNAFSYGKAIMITTKSLTETTNPNNGKDSNSPYTGDNETILLLLVSVLTGFIAIVTKRKHR